MAVKSCYFKRCEAAVCTEISYKKAVFSKPGFFSCTCQTAWPAGVHQECHCCCPFMHRVLSDVKTSGQVSRVSIKHQLFHLCWVKGCYAGRWFRVKEGGCLLAWCSYMVSPYFLGDWLTFLVFIVSFLLLIWWPCLSTGRFECPTVVCLETSLFAV